MEKMRNFMQSWMGKAVLIITLIPMAFLGVQSFSGGGQIAPDEVVKVGDTAINTNTFNSEVNDYRSRLLEQVDGSMIDDKALHDEVLNSLIDRALLENQAQFFGMTVSDEAITRLLQSDPTFQDANGQFSNDIFAQYLQSRGMNKDMLFAMFRTQLSLRQLTSSILGTALYSDDQISRLIDLQSQSRQAWVLRYDWQDFADKVTVSPAEIETYYNANKADMIRSPTVDLAYISLTSDDIKVAPPTESEIQAEYEASLQNSGGDGRQLAHILLTGADAERRAQDIKARLDKGESFEVLAKSHSDDPTGDNGGEIGTYNPALFGDSSAAVQSALSGLNEGDVSEPVKTGFGYHIFKVTKMVDVPSIDSMRDELIKKATDRKHANALNEMIAKINNMAMDSMGIADIAQETGLTAKSIKSYTKENNTSELSAPVVVSAAFDDLTISEQAVSPNITLADRMVWVQPTNYQEAKTLSLAEANEQIKAILTKQKATNLALQAAKDKSQENADSIVKSAQNLGVITRQSQNLLPAERASLFVHNKDGMSVWTVETEQGASLMVGESIQNATTSQISAEERLSASTIIRDNIGQDQFQDYLHYLRDTNEVQINEQVVSGR